MALISTSVLMVEKAPQNGCLQHLCPQWESQLPPTSPGDSPRSASGSDPSPFQITASVLDLEHVKFCAHDLLSSSSSVCKPCWPSKPDILEACFPGAGPLD